MPDDLDSIGLWTWAQRLGGPRDVDGLIEELRQDHLADVDPATLDSVEAALREVLNAERV